MRADKTQPPGTSTRDYRFEPLALLTKSNAEVMHLRSSRDALVFESMAIVLAQHLPVRTVVRLPKATATRGRQYKLYMIDLMPVLDIKKHTFYLYVERVIALFLVYIPD